MMKFLINIGLNKEHSIAKFENEHDRDICIDALRKEHPDVGENYFKAVDIKE